MTAMMQLTETDFSYVFKSLMRKSVDEISAKREEAMGTSDVYQMGMKDIAQCWEWLKEAMRRNGY